MLDQVADVVSPQDLEVEYFAMSHGISVEQAQDLLATYSYDRVEMVRAATRLSQAAD